MLVYYFKTNHPRIQDALIYTYKGKGVPRQDEVAQGVPVG
jgi:hypothetical protein